MSEQDLGLKVASRRLLWRMGYTTRLDVQLRGAGGPSMASDTSKEWGRRTGQPESFTDLDVLGLSLTGGARLHSTIVDCKTTERGSTGRMFWVRGVGDFFAADDAYMVRDSVVTDAARQLAVRLGITTLTSKDLSRLEELHPCDIPLDTAPISYLFDVDSAANVLAAFNGLNKKLKPLLDYREFGYWLHDDHRNLMQLVEYLRACADLLDPRIPHHLALVLDLTWLYLVSLSQAIHVVRSAHVSDPDRGLQEYLFGGVAGLREKEQLSGLLASLREGGALPAEVRVDPLPDYYPKLRELTTRVMRRPDRVLPALRLLEVLTTAIALVQRVEPAELGSLHEDLAAKQAADVVQFLVSTAGLDDGFRARARSLLFGEPVPRATE
ncbi:hypothetical protein Q5425_21130 [Amycolatopsis sp. A133]|uniref:hypothetical protein n=1 Tax=Amycolatopsis sp. A133 TaxID=3064472 RepID=UPI0027F174FA|nr:hypothetical protein [Amycolatopsis sp. A133]MDQ7806254.1 hypothetical protein [Amycolatopsis sp. A133]